MEFEEIQEIIIQTLGTEVVLQAEPDITQPALTIKTESIVEVCQLLRDHEQTFFDMLSCLTGIDNGVEADTMEVIYHLYSIPFEHSLVLKVVVPRYTNEEKLPEVPSVSGVWLAANWLERDAYDLLGIVFKNHPDLRRILLPADWEGFPLRKDYKEQEKYHGMNVVYDRDQYPSDTFLSEKQSDKDE
ncbi:MAG: NADH-quinone oxidoreductase subunit C [Thermonemataceae bacterium]